MDTEARMVSMRAKNRLYRYAVWFFFTGWMWALSPAAAGTAPSHAPSAADHVAPKVTLSAAEVEIGGTLLVRIDCRRVPAACRDLRVAFYDQGIMIFPSPGRGPEVQAGFVGIPLTAPPGKTHLTIEWGSGNQRLSRKVPFEIRPGMYGEETLTVDPRHVRPGPKDLERIRREQEELKKIFASSSRLPFWQGDFQIPVPGEMSGAFGTRRIFNGELLSHHTGVDFRAQTGDPVAAAASGVVRLTKDLFYSGNAVIIDHGGGVFSSYSHLSRIDVKAGQKIGKGQTVGLAGATGRATGPHLHWGVKVNSINVNPLAFANVAGHLGGD
jgi:Peptidase family M23